MSAIVALKTPSNAKSRLAPALSGAARIEIFFQLAQHVLATVAATPQISELIVVTSSSTVMQLGLTHGARIVREPREQGLVSAFERGLREAGRMNVDAVLLLAGDLPLIMPGSLTRLIAATPTERGIVISPDRQRAGTNALITRLPSDMPLAFGEGSFRSHQKLAGERQLVCQTHLCREIELDIDCPADLKVWRQRSKEFRGSGALTFPSQSVPNGRYSSTIKEKVAWN